MSNNKIHYKCLRCNKTFVDYICKNRKYCSQKCANPRENYLYIKGKWYRGKCIDCLNPVQTTTAKRCRPCFIKTKIGIPLSSGEQHHNWKGGITPKNKLLRSSARMIAWRKAIFERDNYTCQTCHQYGGELQADHIKPFSTYPALRFELGNGRTLCKPCHLKTPTWGRKAKYAN